MLKLLTEIAFAAAAVAGIAMLSLPAALITAGALGVVVLEVHS